MKTKKKFLCFSFFGKPYRVDSKGRINANGLNYFSNNWIFLGGSSHRWHNRITVTREQALENPKLLNGCLGWDMDHGTARQWGGRYLGRLPRILNAHIEIN
jgi:hypothetical protein